MYVCLGVCLGKHTYLEKYRYVRYVCMSKVCMSGETYIPRNSRYVCMYVCQRYVYLGQHTYLEDDRYVCMSGETYIPRKL